MFQSRGIPNDFLIYLPPEKLTKKPDKTPGITRLYCVLKTTEKELDEA